jgi:hypothetical protein
MLAVQETCVRRHLEQLMMTWHVFRYRLETLQVMIYHVENLAFSDPSRVRLFFHQLNTVFSSVAFKIFIYESPHKE